MLKMIKMKFKLIKSCKFVKSQFSTSSYGFNSTAKLTTYTVILNSKILDVEYVLRSYLKEFKKISSTMVVQLYNISTKDPYGQMMRFGVECATMNNYMNAIGKYIGLKETYEDMELINVETHLKLSLVKLEDIPKIENAIRDINSGIVRKPNNMPVSLYERLSLYLLPNDKIITNNDDIRKIQLDIISDEVNKRNKRNILIINTPDNKGKVTNNTPDNTPDNKGKVTNNTPDNKGKDKAIDPVIVQSKVETLKLELNLELSKDVRNKGVVNKLRAHIRYYEKVKPNSVKL